MNNFGELWREHKFAVIGLGGAVVILFYLLSRGGSSSSQQNPAAQILGYNQQQNELNAQVALQQSQIGAQQDAVQQQAQAQEQQVQAAEAAQNEQTDASLIANLYDTQQGTKLGVAQLGTEESITNNQTNAQLEAVKTQYGSADYQAGLTAQLYGQGLTDSTKLSEDQITAEEQALQEHYNQNASIINEVGAAGLNHGTASLENSLTGILAGVEGQPEIGVAAENANAIGSEASAFQNSSIWNSIASIGKTTISGIL